MKDQELLKKLSSHLTLKSNNISWFYLYDDVQANADENPPRSKPVDNNMGKVHQQIHCTNNNGERKLSKRIVKRPV